MRLRALFVVLVLLIVALPLPSEAGDGPVALQTADPSCPDDSGNIYVDCGNGTATDNRTGLVWLKNANCIGSAGGGIGGIGDVLGRVDWFTAMEFVAGLSDLPGDDPDDCSLEDGSSPGEWRLPFKAEWQAMAAEAMALGCVSGEFGGPSITNDSGESCWREGPGNSFTGVVSATHWSSTTLVGFPMEAWDVFLSHGEVGSSSKTAARYVWPVRGGQ